MFKKRAKPTDQRSIINEQETDENDLIRFEPKIVKKNKVQTEDTDKRLLKEHIEAEFQTLSYIDSNKKIIT